MTIVNKNNNNANTADINSVSITAKFFLLVFGYHSNTQKNINSLIYSINYLICDTLYKKKYS